ncbi:transposase family protein [Rhodovastum atsumiense]|uniref:transposase family protein n=1 Tax=Rhodovastum atsumiense TaxID=504468 RepID=UPI0038D019AB
MGDGLLWFGFKRVLPRLPCRWVGCSGAVAIYGLHLCRFEPTSRPFLFPAFLPRLSVRPVLLIPDDITLHADVKLASAPCPDCGRRSRRQHSRYLRTLADLPLQDHVAGLQVRGRPFRCDTPSCSVGSLPNGCLNSPRSGRGEPCGLQTANGRSHCRWAASRERGWRRDLPCRSAMTPCCAWFVRPRSHLTQRPE